MKSTCSAAVPPLLLLLLAFFNAKNEAAASTPSQNPFNPKAFVIRYWQKQVSNNSPKPPFLLGKASPLTATDYATFAQLADRNSLSAHLPDFCTKANLLCFPEVGASLEKHSHDVNFVTYNNKNFTKYGTDHDVGADSFSKYSEKDNVILDNFRQYSRGSNDHNDKFTAYATESNMIDQRFNTYGTSANNGEGEFKNYNHDVNKLGLKFTSYSDSSNARKQTFTRYSEDVNAGDQSFTSYGKNGNDAANDFVNYGNTSNVVGSTFVNYGENGNTPKDTFTSYGTNGNRPENNFRTYGTDANDPNETFKNYRDQSNEGDDSFQSYAKKANTGNVDFVNYGHSFNNGTDKFSGYGHDEANPVTVGFKIYGVNNTFKDYQKQGATFSTYVNDSSSVVNSSHAKGKKVNSWVVEPGKFFREEMLKSGTIMPMPDIHDKMPKRSFLPRAIVSKLPFSTKDLAEMKKLFHASDDSSLAKMMTDSLSDCERAPSPGEVKICVPSIEDMIDFATSVLGRNVVVRSTENIQGSKGNIILGKVMGINGGNVTKSVSCHQSLYPYMLYYCHSVPKVRVYEADILDPTSKARINHGVAICHLDTSSWSSGHGAFIALGSKPGKIEVCHWIFENDMTWTIAD